MDDALSKRRNNISREKNVRKQEDILCTLNICATSIGEDVVGLEALLWRIREAQKHNVGFKKMMEINVEGFHTAENGMCMYKGQIRVPDDKGIKDEILSHAHCSRFSVHPRTNKMNFDLKRYNNWGKMKHNVAVWVSKC